MISTISTIIFIYLLQSESCSGFEPELFCAVHFDKRVCLPLLYIYIYSCMNQPINAGVQPCNGISIQWGAGIHV